MKKKIYSQMLFATLLLLNFVCFGAVQKDAKDNQDEKTILEKADSIRLMREKTTLSVASTYTPLLFPTVMGIGSLGKKGNDNIAVFNDFIVVKVDSLPAMEALIDSIGGKKKDTMADIILYINGNAMYDIGLITKNKANHELVFKLDRHSKFLMKFFPQFSYPWSKLEVSVGAGFKNGMEFPVDPSVKALKISRDIWSIIFSLVFIASIIISFIILAAKTNLIRTGDNHSPFSLALSQFGFWTIVIASSFIYLWIITDELPPITGSTLILLTMSTLTTAGSRLVDIRVDTKAHLQPSTNFLEDILQDDLGYSVHRAQMFLWTIIMGIVFVTSVIRAQLIPQIDETLLGLMGISSTAFVGLKTMENKKEDEPKTTEDKVSG
jgi:hypothetical protein